MHVISACLLEMHVTCHVPRGNKNKTKLRLHYLTL